MNILLSNDDGFSALGINVLDEVLSRRGHNVMVCAPDREQSGKSHSMTICGRIKVTEYGKNRFHLSGTPADCIIYSYRSSLLPCVPDVVVSGINHGYNLSSDILYSGTCAAARQAAFYDLKAIAISAESSADRNLFEKSANMLADNLEHFIDSIQPSSFLNINVPPHFSGEYEKAGIGLVRYLDDVVIVREEGKVKELEIRNCEFQRFPSAEGYKADYEVCRTGKAALTLVDVLPHVSKGMENL